ncbi:hypothetical protein OBBRIDRAFT_274914 [Obba rivulosa]|uniref:Uncharacterized protein n=1 Tax=Obba rivulosa TaxID=1052685 RepID=A0A8E2AP96_9APHY|nr:hypothetical protein OBBRIDRAFT_274914 [Obba rivulosa]
MMRSLHSSCGSSAESTHTSLSPVSDIFLRPPTLSSHDSASNACVLVPATGSSFRSVSLREKHIPSSSLEALGHVTMVR